VIEFEGLETVTDKLTSITLTFPDANTKMTFLDSFYSEMIDCELGLCDCGRVYYLGSIDDHCGDCGSCLVHCTCDHPNPHYDELRPE